MRKYLPYLQIWKLADVAYLIFVLFTLILHINWNFEPQDSHFSPNAYYILFGSVSYPIYFTALFIIFLSPLMLFFYIYGKEDVRKKGIEKIFSTFFLNYLFSIPLVLVLLYIAWNLAPIFHSIRHENNAKVIRLKILNIEELDTNGNGKLDTLRVLYTLDSDVEVTIWGGTRICLGSHKDEGFCRGALANVPDDVLKGINYFNKRITFYIEQAKRIVPKENQVIAITLTGREVSMVQYKYPLSQPINLDRYESLEFVRK